MRKLPITQLVKEQFPEYSSKEIFSLILCGEVYVGDEKVSSHKTRFSVDSLVAIKTQKYVSRGGFKLQTALDYWKYRPSGKIVVDAGSSTGGFTDCLLQAGASRVYAVDVGYNQLAYKIRSDKRVVVMEKTNILGVESLYPVPDFAVADLSFRSITGAARKLLELTSESLLFALIKPQFEILSHEKDSDFNGVLTDRNVIADVLLRVAADLSKESCFVQGCTPSAVKGRRGNQEFLFKITAEESEYSLEEDLQRFRKGS